MTQDIILQVFRECLLLCIKLGGPLLLVSMAVGLVISILQAATQVHEQTLTFAPKAVAVGLTLFFLGPWMMEECIDFINFITEKMAQIPIT